MHIRHAITLTHFEIFNGFQRKRRHVENLRRFDTEEIGSAHILEHERRTGVIMLRQDLHVAHLDSFCVANIKTMGRHISESPWLRISLPLLLGWLKRRLRRSAAAAVLNQDIAQLQVLNWMSGKASKQTRNVRCGVGTDDVADDHSPQSSDRNSFGTSHAVAETDEDWTIDHVAHADVCDRDIFKKCAVDCLQSETPAAIKDTVCDRDSLEPAIG